MNKFNGLTDDALKSERDELLVTIAKLKTQLASAKGKAADTGEYADQKWFNSAQHALRMKGIEHQLICQELGARRRSRGEVRHGRSAKFREFARVILPTTIFEQIEAAVDQHFIEVANNDTE